MGLLRLFYGWPNGLVWANIAAEPIIAVATLLVLWVFRHGLMRRFVAFHHDHKEAHARKLKESGGL